MIIPRILRFLLVAGALPAIPASAAEQVIRIMAANLTSGNYQNYDPGHGNRILKGLAPDIVLVQEMNYLDNTAADFRSWVNSTFGTGFSYFREAGNGIPNGIVSRFPILAAGEWDDPEMTDRDFAWARIDIPGDKDLWAVSVHISASSSTKRSAEATEIRNLVRAHVPAADYLVIGGDFNTGSRTENCVTVLSDVVVTSGPYPADQAGNGNTNASRAKPYDWVMPDADLHARRVALTLGSLNFPNGIVFDSREFTPLAQVSPVQAGDSAASGMQHMGVMRAFAIPVNSPPVIAQGATVARTISRNNHPTAFALTLTATDPDGDSLAWSIATSPAQGVAGVSSTGVVSYVPARDFLGNASFTVRVADGRGGTASTTVQVTVAPVSAYDAWTFDRFAPLTNPSIWGTAADPDGDGYRNFEEFAYGLDPVVKDAMAGILAIARVDDSVEVSFLMRMDGAVPALGYQLECAPEIDGPWSALGAEDFTVTTETAAGPDFRRRTVRIKAPADVACMFYRLRIML